MAAALTLNYTADDASTTAVLVFATRQTTKGRNFPDRGRMKLVSVLFVEIPGPYSLTAAYTALFGPLVAQKRIFLSLVPVSAQGTHGPKQNFRVDVS